MPFDFTKPAGGTQGKASRFDFSTGAASNSTPAPAPKADKKGYTGVKDLVAHTADILINRPKNALLAAAKHDAELRNQSKSTWSFDAIKGGAREFMEGLTGEERPTGEQYFQTLGMKQGMGRTLAGGALDALATPAFNPIMKAGGKVVAPVAKAGTTANRILGAGAAGAIYGTGTGIAAEKPAGEILKSAAENAAGFAAGEGLVVGAGKAIKKVFDFSKPAAKTAKYDFTEPAAAPKYDFTKPADPAVEAPAASKTNMESMYNMTRDELQDFFRNVDPVENVKDITGFQGYARDVYRNLRDAFGDNFEPVKQMLLDPFDASKAESIKFQEKILQDLRANVVERLGIKKGSKLSKLVQRYGEKTMTPEEWNSLTPEMQQRIVDADNWFRNSYNQLIDDVNKVKEQIYPFADDRMKTIQAKIEDLKTPGKYSRKAQKEQIDALEWELKMMRNSPNRPNTSDNSYMRDLQNRIDDLSNPIKYSSEAQQKILRDLEWELKMMRNSPHRRGGEDSQVMKQLASKIEEVKNDPKFNELQRKNLIENLQTELNSLRSSRVEGIDDTLYMKKLESKIQDIKDDPVFTAEGRQSMIEALEKEHEHALRGKRVPKRDDYYRHFRELTEGYQGLRNIFDSPSNIDPALEGLSHETLPRSKWLSFGQKRTGGMDYTEDAVGGFLDYLPAASNAIHIDPHISRFQALADELTEATTISKNANNLVRFLREYSQDLAGKTNPADRFIQEAIPGGRKAFTALVWVNNRIKANTVLANASSAVAQVANVPQGLAFAKQYSAPGLKRTFTSLLGGKNEAAAQSGFLAERFAGKMYRQFDDKLLSQPKNAAVWIMETADRLGTEFIWNSCYEKAVAEGIANPIRFADFNTRRLVAGRGVGEVPLGQKAKIFQLIAPFQLEVGNLWHVMSDMKQSKDITGFAVLTVALWMFNRGAEAVRGSGVTFDPLQAVIEAAQSDNLTSAAGRLTGEVLSNVPLGQTAASWYPEAGFNFMGAQMPSRKEFFGREDPTRFGTGPLLTKALTSPQTRLLTPFGGVQLEKTYKGLKAIGERGVYDKQGNLKYPIETTPLNTAKGLLFGPGGFEESTDYYKGNTRPLSAKQTQRVQGSGDPEAEYKRIQAKRALDKLARELKAVDKQAGLSPAEKAKRKAELRQRYLQQAK